MACKLDIITDLHYTNLDIDYDGKADADADAEDTGAGFFCQLCNAWLPGWQTGYIQTRSAFDRQELQGNVRSAWGTGEVRHIESCTA